jgi:hypothetical protein
MSNPEKSQEGQYGNLPPPPAGPPPAGQPHFTHPPAQQFDQQQQYYPPPPPNPPHSDQQQHQQQGIPSYNPANPVFAPPLVSELPADNYTSSSPNPQYQQQNQQPPPQHHDHDGEGHKSGWSERFAHIGSMAAAPINNLAHKFGSQSFLPETLDRECDKAALIIKTFCSKPPSVP